jgi:putative ABC transport system permease protein
LHDTIHLSHESGANAHVNRDFHICGILQPTQTPNDKTVFFQLKADEAIHLEWQSGTFVDMHLSSKQLEAMNIEPKNISGVYIGLKNPYELLHVSDKIEHLHSENLKAIIPAKALSQLYFLLKNMQEILTLISAVVFLAAIFGMVATMLATLNDRRREIAILRMLGASVKAIFILFAQEAFMIVASGIVLGNIMLTCILFLNNLIFNETVQISYIPDFYEVSLLLIMMLLAIIVSTIPALKSYKNSLQDGLMVKI